LEGIGIYIAHRPSCGNGLMNTTPSIVCFCRSRPETLFFILRNRNRLKNFNILHPVIRISSNTNFCFLRIYAFICR